MKPKYTNDYDKLGAKIDFGFPLILPDLDDAERILQHQNWFSLSRSANDPLSPENFDSNQHSVVELAEMYPYTLNFIPTQ